MTITVQFKTHKKRYFPGVLFEADTDDVGDIIIDYAGELGADTVSAATVTSDNVTAGTPSISSNVVTIGLNGFNEGSSKIEIKMTTASASVLSSVIRFRATDYYNKFD